MKSLLLSWVFLFISYTVFCMPIQGKVKVGEKGLSQIIITDGYQFTQTDKQGNFKLDTDKNAKFVYLITPSGYTANYTSGTPEFYQNLQTDQTEYIFNLTPNNITENHTLIAIADVQTRSNEQFERFQRESIPDLKETISSHNSNSQVIGISLGDIVWDYFDHFPIYKKEMSLLQIPFYPVIGNHDHNAAITDDKASAQNYETYFGPTYYAFQMNDVFCIVLDNILYTGNKKYTEALTNEQITWVKGLLNYLPKQASIIIASHSPFHYANRGFIPGGEELLNILQGYHVELISGHTHLNSNHEIKNGIIEHNIGAICGTWWTAEENRDGTPNGYGVFDISNNKIKWYYKSVGHNRNWQFKLYPQGTVTEKKNSIIAKVWNWDPSWNIKWYEDGIDKGQMQRYDGFDPDYLQYVANLKTEKHTKPQQTFFYFEATPSPNAQYIEVEVTDRFGTTFPRQKINL